MASEVKVLRSRRFARWVRLPAAGSVPAGARLVLASAATLREAPDEDKEAIVAFIRTLAGESEEFSP